MFPTRFRLSTLAALVFLPAISAAAAPLTWTLVVEQASAGNPDLQAARERVRQAEFSRKAAAAPFLPQVSIGAGYGRTGGEASADDAYSLSASARQSLYAGGQNAASFRRSGAELQAADVELDSTRAAVSFDLKAAFARLLFSQQQLELSRSIEKRRSENVRLVGLRYEAGREHKGSFLRSRANARQAGFEVSQSGRGLRVAQRELLRATGRSEFDAIAATGTLVVGVPGTAPDFPTLAALVPSVRAAAAALAASEADVSSARGELLPALDATGSAGRSGETWPPEDDRWSAGVSVSLPIFQGGRNVYGLKTARASLRQSGERSRAARDEAALNLESSYASFADAAERADVQAEFLQAATVRAEIARSQYTSGLLSFEDWDLIESDLITAQKNHLASLRDAVIAEADWERAQGKGAVQ